MSAPAEGRFRTVQGCPLTILIIDDNPEDAELLARHLTASGESVTCHHAPLGELGGQLLEQLGPDCVLLDYNLPDMTGLEFLEQYRPQVPVLVITGSTEHTVAARVIQAGATRLLYKGDLNGPDLRAQITDGLQEHALRGQLRLERQRMQAVLDSTGHGMLFIRPQLDGWTVEFLNPAARQLLHLTHGPLPPEFTPLLGLLRQTQLLGVPLDVTLERGGRSLTLDCCPGADGFTVTVRDSTVEHRRHRLDLARHEVLQRFVESRVQPDVLRGLQDLITATLPGHTGQLLTGPALQAWPQLGTLGVSADRPSGQGVQATFLPDLNAGCWALPIKATDEEQLLGVLLVDGTSADLNVPSALRDVISLSTLLLMQSRNQERLQYQAWRDPLTGLPNRSVFMEQLQRELHSLTRNGSSLAVGVLDLDGFKGVNDTFGHACGDALLVEVARRLRLAFRASDLVARVGGDEFTLLLTDWVNHESLEADLRRRLQQVMASPFSITGVNVEVRASLGVALAPQQAQSADGLLHLADRAMYFAKRGGGGLHLNTETHLPGPF